MIFAAMTLNVMPLPPILQQGYAGGSTAVADISLSTRTVSTPSRAPANDGHFAGSSFKRGIVGKKAVFQVPKRMSGS